MQIPTIFTYPFWQYESGIDVPAGGTGGVIGTVFDMAAARFCERMDMYIAGAFVTDGKYVDKFEFRPARYAADTFGGSALNSMRSMMLICAPGCGTNPERL
jgi:hypothetical protein